jgi:tetratricopeptide (TPR) repeat protein
MGSVLPSKRRRLVETGDWERAEEVLATATRLGGTFWPHRVEMLRAELELARGELERARRHLDAAAAGATRPFAAAPYARLVAELALWEGRVDDAVRAVDDGIRLASPDEQPRLYALALRAQAERAQLAADRRDRRAVAAARSRAAKLLDEAREAAATAAAISPKRSRGPGRRSGAVADGRILGDVARHGRGVRRARPALRVGVLPVA